MKVKVSIPELKDHEEFIWDTDQGFKPPCPLWRELPPCEHHGFPLTKILRAFAESEEMESMRGRIACMCESCPASVEFSVTKLDD